MQYAYLMGVKREEVDRYLGEVSNPSMWGLALDLGWDVDALGDLARTDRVLRYALQRIVALAESRLYSAVYGPLAVIKRVETVLGAGLDGVGTVYGSVEGRDEGSGVDFTPWIAS